MSIRSNVDARALNERVRFIRKTVDQDANGFPTQTETDLGTVWAKVDGLKASERYVAAGERAVGAVTIWVRSEVVTRLALTAADIVEWKGQRYDIEDIPDQQLRGRLIAIFAKRGLNEG